MYFNDIGSYYDDTPRVNENATLERVSEPATEPVTPAEVVSFLKRHPDDLTLYADAIDLCISTARERIEGFTERAAISTTYRQVMDAATGRRIKLLRRNVLSVSSVEYYPDMSSTSLSTFAASNYFLERGGAIVTRDGAWPSHRGSASLIITFTAGYMAYPGTYPGTPLTDDEKSALRAAVPNSVRMACLNLIGHWLENPEGQSTEIRYEVQAKTSSVMPPNVLALLRRSGGINWGT